jgi:hypothetical protein
LGAGFERLVDLVELVAEDLVHLRDAQLPRLELRPELLVEGRHWLLRLDLARLAGLRVGGLVLHRFCSYCEKYNFSDIGLTLLLNA